MWMWLGGWQYCAAVEAVGSSPGWGQPGSLSDGMERFGRNIAPMGLLWRWKDRGFPYHPTLYSLQMLIAISSNHIPNPHQAKNFAQTPWLISVKT